MQGQTKLAALASAAGIKHELEFAGEE